jgi:hypothetical protein
MLTAAVGARECPLGISTAAVLLLPLLLLLLLLLLKQAGDQAAAASLHEILNPLDELQYWADMAGNPAMGKQACSLAPAAVTAMVCSSLCITYDAPGQQVLMMLLCHCCAGTP